MLPGPTYITTAAAPRIGDQKLSRAKGAASLQPAATCHLATCDLDRNINRAEHDVTHHMAPPRQRQPSSCTGVTSSVRCAPTVRLSSRGMRQAASPATARVGDLESRPFMEKKECSQRHKEFAQPTPSSLVAKQLACYRTPPHTPSFMHTSSRAHSIPCIPPCTSPPWLTLRAQMPGIVSQHGYEGHKTHKGVPAKCYR